MKQLAPMLFLLLLLAAMIAPSVFAAINFDQPITPAEEQQFDQMLSPLMKIYNFIKYAATVIGVLMLVFAGITYITSGGDQGKNQMAKNMAMGVVIGLILIWIAPLVVRYIFV